MRYEIVFFERPVVVLQRFFPLFLLAVVVQTVLIGRSFSDETKLMSTYAEVKEEIRNFYDVNGYIPTESDYFDIIFMPTNNLTSQEQAELFGQILSLQNPRVDKISLLKIIGSKKESINSLKVRYNLTFHGRLRSSVVCIYAFLGEKRYFERIGKILDADEEQIIFAYDGSLLRIVTNPNDIMPNVSIDLFTAHHDIFFQPTMPLFAAMLFDTTHFPSVKYVHDVLFFLEDQGTQVFEKTEIIDGKACIIAANFNTRVLLCPEMNYAVMQFEVYNFDYDDQGLPIGRSLLVKRELRDHKYYGNGIWLPTRIVTSEFFDKNNPSQTVVMVDEMEVNPAIDPNFFADVIPENAFVIDGVRGLTYFQSDSPSINDTLKAVAKSKRTWFLQYLSLTVGCILILLVVVVKYIKYLKQKQTA
ncbi:MAG: hypothetical protein FWG73_02205 [Planctomycetaceae bacterium]|nr:hypothetical protein [Planctomycetaceae bacterium]